MSADPDTPTADAPATCNSGVGGGETCALPRGHSGPHDPDAPISNRTVASVTDHDATPTGPAMIPPTADAPADTDLRERIEWLIGNAPARLLVDALLLVFAEHERAQVEAARRDALNEAAARMRLEVDHTVASVRWLRDRAARGETRQP